jgi:hypothetical protein
MEHECRVHDDDDDDDDQHCPDGQYASRKLGSMVHGNVPCPSGKSPCSASVIINVHTIPIKFHMMLPAHAHRCRQLRSRPAPASTPASLCPIIDSASGAAGLLRSSAGAFVRVCLAYAFGRASGNVHVFSWGAGQLTLVCVCKRSLNTLYPLFHVLKQGVAQHQKGWLPGDLD